MGAEQATVEPTNSSEAGEKQTEEVQATIPETGVEETEAKVETASDSTVEEGAEDGIKLLSDDEIKGFDGDSTKLVDALNKAATQKFQDLSKEKKDLEPYSEFLEALDRDPEKTVRALANRLGIAVESDTKEKAKEAAATLTDEVTQIVAEELGADYEDLASKLGPAIQRVAEKVAEQTARPLVDGQEQIIRDSSARQAESAMKSFGEKHPGWKKHEKAMVAISKRLPPGDDATNEEYLEDVYFLATRSESEGEAVKKATDKMKKSAKKSGEPKSVSDKLVAQRPDHLPTFGEAADAARQGIRFE